MDRHRNPKRNIPVMVAHTISAAHITKSIVFAALFSLMQVLAEDLRKDNKINGNPLHALVLFFACLCVSFVVSVFFMKVVEKTIVLFHAVDHMDCDSRSFSIKNYVMLNIRNMLFWMPYYILFFPGTSNNGDTEKQIRMFFHREEIGLPLTASPVQGPNIYITDHHPVFTTWLYGSFVKLGLFMGGAAIGVAIFAFLQMLCYSLVLTWIWARLPQLGANRSFVKAGLWFTALFPYYPTMSVCMVKDITFSFFCLLLMLLLFELWISQGALWGKKWFTPILTLTVLLFILSKGQGKYLAVLLFLILLFAYRENWKKLIVAFVIPILFVQTIWVHVLFPLWNISPGGKQETIGPLFQQTARYVVTYGNEVTEEERDAISALIDYDHLTELYDPELTDPVKMTFNQATTDAQLKAYYKCWISMLMKHPGVYFAATLNTSYRFFDITWKAVPIFTRFKNRVAETDELYIKSLFTDGQLTYIIRDLVLKLESLPLIGLIFVPSFYTWLTIFLFFVMLGKNNRKQIAAAALPFLSVFIYFACPGNLPRYTMPIILMTTVMLVNTHLTS